MPQNQRKRCPCCHSTLRTNDQQQSFGPLGHNTFDQFLADHVPVPVAATVQDLFQMVNVLDLLTIALCVLCRQQLNWVNRVFQWVLLWFLLLFRYTKRVRPSRYGYSAKSITRTLSCVGLQNHYCWVKLPTYSAEPNWNVDVPTYIGKSHHYKKCHFDNYLHRNGVCHRMVTRHDATGVTMLRFRDRLAHTVANKLLQLDLVEKAQDDSWRTLHPIRWCRTCRSLDLDLAGVSSPTVSPQCGADAAWV